MMSSSANRWSAWARRARGAAQSFLATRRVLAIDPGNRRLKLVLVERRFGRLRRLRSHAIDLPAEGSFSRDETGRRLQGVLDDLESAPIALAAPQHLALSEVIDPPLAATSREVAGLIEQETIKLSGLSGSPIVYDSASLRPFGQYKNPVWLTLSQESRLFEEICRLQLAQEDICEITPQANALIAAYQAIRPETENVVLVDLGAASTVMAVVANGQGVRATSLSLGGDRFTEAIAGDRRCSIESAELAKCSENLFTQLEAMPALQSIIDQWKNELVRNGKEFLEEHAQGAGASQPFPAVLSGGGARQAGLIEYLNRGGPFRFELWPSASGPADDSATGRFAIALGTALTALGKSRHSLLPADLRVTWRRRYRSQWIQSLNLLLLGIGALLLVFGTWQKLHLAHARSLMLTRTRTALQEVQQTRLLEQERQSIYQGIRPVFERQKQTLEALRTLALLQQIKSNRSLWFVLFADQQTYFSTQPPTNAAAPRIDSSPATNAPAARHGFVAELCLVEQGEAMRQTLSRIVADLKADPLFANVDSLPSDRRRKLVDPKVVLADHYFSLAIDCVENEFRRPSGTAEKGESGAAPRDERPAATAIRPKAPQSSSTDNR
jgi:Tfp pilus assembly PilM family ATPase